jgi:tRNA pseudouridine65 synthase
MTEHLFSITPVTPAGQGAATLDRQSSLPIVYRSAGLVAVDKPSGLAVHRGQAQDSVHALELVRDQVGAYVYPVHRLDRATSGVLVFALSPEAARILSSQFEAGSVEKRYVAIVRGAPPENTRVDHPLSREDGKPPQWAVTDLRTLLRYGRYALVEAIPRSGRTHQIRRHLKHLSCPIIGDVRYGKGDHNRWFRTRYAFHRLALHASSLTLFDSATQEHVTIHAPLPHAMATTLVALERDSAVGLATGPR